MGNNETRAQIAVGTASLLDRLKALAQESYFTDSLEESGNKRKVYQANYNSETAMVEVHSYIIASIVAYHFHDKVSPQIFMRLNRMNSDGSTNSLGSDFALNNFFSTPEEAKKHVAMKLQNAAKEILKNGE